MKEHASEEIETISKLFEACEIKETTQNFESITVGCGGFTFMYNNVTNLKINGDYIEFYMQENKTRKRHVTCIGQIIKTESIVD